MTQNTYTQRDHHHNEKVNTMCLLNHRRKKTYLSKGQEIVQQTFISTVDHIYPSSLPKGFYNLHYHAVSYFYLLYFVISIILTNYIEYNGHLLLIYFICMSFMSFRIIGDMFTKHNNVFYLYTYVLNSRYCFFVSCFMFDI